MCVGGGGGGGGGIQPGENFYKTKFLRNLQLEIVLSKQFIENIFLAKVKKCTNNVLIFGSH